MIVRVLGSAAGGGVPQWNCACANCAAARTGRQPRRTQSGFAMSADGDRWQLLNCSPDIAEQIEAFPPLQPRGVRGTPIDGMLITDANIDHLGGLAVLRQEGNHRFVVRSSSAVREIAMRQRAFAPFAAPPHKWLEVSLEVTRDGVSALPVPGLTPGYEGRRAIRGAVVAYEIVTQSGKRILFAPVFASIDKGLREAIERADVAFLDGSFFTDDELAARGLSDKRATDLGHQPMQQTLAYLRESGFAGRTIFTHVNNSNPILDPDSAAAAAVRDAGAEIAYDGMELTL